MARELTEQETKAAKILKQAWLQKKSQHKDLSQEKLAEKLGLTQAGVSHYLNGRRAIGLELLMKFCSELDVDILDVYPDILMKNKVQDTAQALEFLNLFLNADEGVKIGVLAILRSSSPS